VLGRVTREAAERFGERTCYVSADGSTVSYRELDERADAVARGMAAAGIGEGDVVALLLGTVAEYPIAYVAAARLGAITAGVNTRLTATERERVLATADPELVLDSVEAVRALASAGGHGPVPTIDDDPSRPVAIVFTSGTTGTPKGALFCGRQLEFVTEVDTGWAWGDADRPPAHTFAATSFAHLGPMTKLPGTLLRGGTTHLLERWRAGDALRLLAEHRMAGFGGIPTQLALLLRHPDFDACDVSSVQAIVVGGGPATPALVREARERFGAAVSVRYSCTEAGIGVGTAFDDPPEDAEVSVGRPHHGVDLAIRDGEVCLRSPAVMSGYWRDDEATAAAFTDDGFVRTGDVGSIDDHGRLRLAGRTREMYVRGGYNVFPAEVEAVLATHPGIAEVAVVPRPDDVMGEVGVAVVVPRHTSAPPSLDDLRTFGAPQLAAFKLPEAVQVVDALPLTAMDKVDRRALAAMVEEG
jgi:acyl-CoA synthetase (AMP-forming)/AMP-acid ligase II